MDIVAECIVNVMYVSEETDKRTIDTEAIAVYVQ